MRGRRAAILLGAIGFGAAACGDQDPGQPGADAVAPDGAAPDAAPVDAAAPPPDAPPPNPLGMPCPTGTECAPAFPFCLDEGEGWTGEGFCTRTCASDADCGAGGACSPDLGGARICLPACDAGGCALADRVCTDRLAGFLPLAEPACLPGDPTAVDGDGCVTFADCNARSACLWNPFDLPGGYCVTVGCTPGDDTTCAPGGDGLCIAGDGTPLCVDRCASATDCRAGEGYDCVNAAPGIDICFHPHAPPGSPCAVDADCGPPPWECVAGVGGASGYCGADGCDPADGATCPFDTICYDATPGTLDGSEFCAKTCATSMDCPAGTQCSSSGGGPDVCR